MKRVLFAIAIAAVAAASSVSAHHSYSAYHVDRLVEVEGVIDDFEWRTGCNSSEQFYFTQ